MTAEIYHQENDLEDARTRLQKLGIDSPEQYAQEALLAAGQLGYGQTDLQILSDLLQALSPGATVTPGVTESPQP